jgi:putative ABC transport system ATP-binding protein
MSEPVLFVNDVFKIYTEGTGEERIETVALRGVTFKANPGELITIVGPSGSGKSSLIHLLACLDRVSAGRILYYPENVGRRASASKGVDITSLPRRELEDFRIRNIGVIFQLDNLVSHLSASQNIELPLRFGGIPRKERRERVREVLKAVGLEERKSHRPYQLSGGEKQRVAVASALALRPLIMLADEPTGELDTESTEGVLKAFKVANEEFGMTVLMVSHNPQVAKAGKRVIEIKDGVLREVPSSSILRREEAIITDLDDFDRLKIPASVLERYGFSDQLVAFDSDSEGISISPAAGSNQEKRTALSPIDSLGRVVVPAALARKLGSRVVLREKKNRVMLEPVQED